MNYYMITFYIDEKTGDKDYRPFINPYESLKDAKNAVNWQAKGGFKNQIIAERIGKTKFLNINTKETININPNNSRPYTVEAWENFLNEYK